MIVLLRRWFWFLAKNESGQQFQRGVIWRFAEGMTPYNSPTQGRGISKGKYKPKLEFLEGLGGGGELKNPPRGGIAMFSINTLIPSFTLSGCW